MNLRMLFFFIFIAALFSCSSPSEETPIIDPVSGPTSISITSDKSTLEVGETVTFTVTDNEDENVTSLSTIQIDGTSISGSTFVPIEAGNYEATSSYESLVSYKIYFTASAPITLTSVNITASSNAIFLGGSVSFTAKAIYSDGTIQDKTSESVFYLDDVLISGNEYTGSQAGTITAKAVFDSTSSSDISVAVVDPSSLPSSFSKKAVVEDFTGTWCGYCPRVSYAASLVEEQTDKVFVVGVHNGDQMANSFGGALEDEFSITGFPTAYIDRVNTWTYPEPSNVDQALNAAVGTADVGLAIESSLTGSVLDFKVYQGFLQNMTGVKLVVFVLEDGILANQSNYTSYYGGASTIVNFEHNGVLRYAATNVMGNSTTSTIGIHEKSFSVDLSSYDVLVPENTHILAMLVSQTGRVVLNAQYAAVNENKPFD
jgi:thiol-disulfide isomerase/thioredoxin